MDTETGVGVALIMKSAIDDTSTDGWTCLLLLATIMAIAFVSGGVFVWTCVLPARGKN